MIFVLFYQYTGAGRRTHKEGRGERAEEIRRVRSKGRASRWGRKKALGAPARKARVARKKGFDKMFK
ncbi:MAG: hypothetical protein A2X93_06980 [Deltaproteobacteria bacterium GWC2_56_8]|nr:MAG: hypothetical protein A2X99_07250 [Deltaproteobacteria bacterium GWB2_55_19]OGP36521.1 MAG: hypothetical protein A2X93_06980 [Deltaproteobacteria bacterium GWC2_56_8]